MLFQGACEVDVTCMIDAHVVARLVEGTTDQSLVRHALRELGHHPDVQSAVASQRYRHQSRWSHQANSQSSAVCLCGSHKCCIANFVRSRRVHGVHTEGSVHSTFVFSLVNERF